MFNKDSIFITKLDDKRQLVLLCGGVIDGTVAYFPTNSIVGDFVIQGGYKDAEPCSALGATTIELQINTASFVSEDEQRLALAIWENSAIVPSIFYTNAPNVWLFIENGKISFVGVQDAVSGDEAYPSGDSPFKIMISSLHKAFLDNAKIQNGTFENPESSTLDCKLWEGFKIKEGMNSEPYYQFYHKIAGWGRSQFCNFDQFVEQFKQWSLLANPALVKFLPLLTDFVSYNITLPKFYKQDLKMSSTDVPSVQIDRDKLLILNAIGDKNNKLIGGARISVYERCKTMYELIKLLCDNLALKMLYHWEHIENFDPTDKAHYATIKLKYDLIPIARKEVFKTKITPNYVIETPKLLRRAGDYLGVLVNNIPIHQSDLQSVSANDNVGINRKTKTVPLLFNTTPTKVLAHLNDPNTPTRDYVALANYSAKDKQAMPIMKFFYSENLCGEQRFLKVSERANFEVGAGQEFDNGFSAVDLFSGRNLDDFNANVETMQSKGLSGVLARIYYEVITRFPLFLEVKISASIISHKDLGKAFEIDSQLLQGANTFWRFTNTSTYAVLTDIKENLTTDICECKFFLRTDKWKI